MKKVTTIFLFLISGIGFGQDSLSHDTCKVFLPLVIVTDCMDQKEYPIKTVCNCELNSYALNVYNRHGEIVHSSSDIDEAWHAIKLKDGAYVWVIKGEFTDSSFFEKTGHVAVVK